MSMSFVTRFQPDSSRNWRCNKKERFWYCSLDVAVWLRAGRKLEERLSLCGLGYNERLRGMNLERTRFGKRAWLALLACSALLIALLSLSAPAQGQQDEEQPVPTPTPTPEQEDSGPVSIDPSQIGAHEHESSLGKYGASGPISRADLRLGLADYVSDEAIRAAESPELAGARSGWEGAPVDFVDQVDYQLMFRAQNDFMSSNLDDLAAVLERRPDNMGFERFGLYMSDGEAAEFERRLTLGDRIPEIIEAVSGVSVRSLPEGVDPVYGEDFGGVWQDQFDGGAIVVAVTDSAAVDLAAVARIAGGEEFVRVLDGHPSWDQVHTWRDELTSQADRNGIAVSVSINSTGKGRILEISTDIGVEVPESLLRIVPSDYLTVVQDGVSVTAGNPLDVHSEASQMAGLNIEFDPGANCTWGISGNNDIDHYMMTAGHCGGSAFHNFNGWTDSLEAHQANSVLLTDGWRYIISTFNSSTIDAKGVSSGFADDNCYHWGHCAKHISNRALHNSYELNSDVSCASLGKSNVWRCGYVREHNWTGSGPCGGNGGWLKIGIPVIPGDSGAGAIYPYSGGQSTFDGILGCQNGSSNSIWTSALLFKGATGLDANCYPVPVIVYSPNWWPTCSGVDR